MVIFHKKIKTLFVISSVVLGSTALAGCELTQNYMKHDRENSMQEQDYRDALAPRQIDVNDKNAAMADVPPLQPYVVQPDNNYRPMPLISVAVNRDVPLRELLVDIARQAQYDVEIDPRIRGSIIFSAKNRPLDMIIDRIAEIAGLRYKFDDDMLRVELDTPYHEIYKVNYLALTRTNASSIRNDISVVTGDGTDTGSSFSADNASVIDFWQELEDNLTQILDSNRDSNRLATSVDPNVTVAQSNPNVQVDPVVMDEDGNLSENGPTVQVQAPDVQLNVESLSIEDDEQEEGAFDARFSLNKQAGLISVFAPERLQKQVASYMDELKKSVSSQVLIEAKVLEVSLNDEFSAGIDWNVLFSGNSGGFGFGPTTAGLVRGVLDADGSLASNSNINFSSGDFSAAIDALSRFGTVQALASPRLTVLNNQSAALNVAENVVFFEIEVETTTSDSGTVVTFDTDANTVPEGVLINVQPAIDLDAQTISMAIRPTITTITGFTNDPNPDLAAQNIESPVPNVNVQEFDSVLTMNNGQAVVLGGLIQDRIESTRNGVPVASEMPIIGGLFRNQGDVVRKTELVVFLRGTIVEGGNTVHNTDRDLYRTFSSDRRPFRL